MLLARQHAPATAGAVGTVAWYLTDRQGSVRQVADAAGNEAYRATYDGFGRVILQSGAGGDRFGYTGRESDAASGLQFNRARYYDPATGRWISRDPIGFAGGDANLYRYVGNGPTNFSDPGGMARYWGQSLWEAGEMTAAVVGGGIRGGFQGVANVANAGTDTFVATRNLAASAANATSRAAGYGNQFDRWIPVDWSYGLVAYEDPYDHLVSKGAAQVAIAAYSGSQAISSLSTAVAYTGSISASANGLLALQPALAVNGQAVASGAAWGSLTGNSLSAMMSAEANSYQPSQDALERAARANNTPSPALPKSPYNPKAVADRIRPPYRSNPAHDPRSPFYNKKKTPEPSDAAAVYQNAVRSDMKTWYGRGRDGKIYRYFYDNGGGTHFSGTVRPTDVPKVVREQLGL